MNFRPFAVEITTTRSRRADLPRSTSLIERGQRDAGVRAVEHAGAIGARRGIGQLGLGGLLDDAVEASAASRIALLDATGLPIWMALASVGLRGHRLEVPAVLVGADRADWRAAACAHDDARQLA